MSEMLEFGYASRCLNTARKAEKCNDYSKVAHEVKEAKSALDAYPEQVADDHAWSAYKRAADQIISEIDDDEIVAVKRCLDQMAEMHKAMKSTHDS